MNMISKYWVIYKNISKFIYMPLLSILSIYFLCFHYVNVGEIAVRRNIINGKLSIDMSPGMYFSSPWTQVAKIDTRPHKVCIECDCRNITCYLVTFNSDGWVDFISKEGFRYYWWSNRFSINMSHENEYRGTIDVLKGYSFDNEEYPFLIIEKVKK